MLQNYSCHDLVISWLEHIWESKSLVSDLCNRKNVGFSNVIRKERESNWFIEKLRNLVFKHRNLG